MMELDANRKAELVRLAFNVIGFHEILEERRGKLPPVKQIEYEALGGAAALKLAQIVLQTLHPIPR